MQQKNHPYFILLFILLIPFKGHTDECENTPLYTTEDNFYYLESPRETHRSQFRHPQQGDRSGGYHDPSFSGMSSYQGTTTGPGPNGGYPGSPRGSYNTHRDYSTRSYQKKERNHL
jgi:hypothetical protein